MEKVKPLVSIIVPNYNHEKYLEQRLKSIFNQTYSNFEVILLDDCSTGKSKEIFLEYAKNPKVSHCIFNEINSGNTFKQWNKGIALSKGEYIWIAESDDFCELNFLEELTQPLIEDNRIVLTYCQSNRTNESGSIKGDWLSHTDSLDSTVFLKNFLMNGNEFIERFLIYRNVIPNVSGVVFRRKNVVQLGNLDIDPVLKTCGDWLFYLKLVSNNKVFFIHKSLNYFRYHSQSVIASAIKREKGGSIIDIEFEMRRKMIDFLAIENINNLSVILKINRHIINELKYKKALFYIRNNEKIKGGLILFTVMDIFIKNFQFKENFKLKRDKFLPYKMKPIKKINLYLKFFVGKKGLEIGGSSPIFSKEIPIYQIIDTLDGCNFSNQTLWEGNIEEGENYNYFESKKGFQYICEASDLNKIGSESYDFLISSHCLEYCGNTLKTFKEWVRVVKKGGAILLILPDKKYTFDHNRPITTFKHLVNDLKTGKDESDLTHLLEILELHDLKMDLAAGTKEQFKMRSLDNYKNRCLHQHVFDFKLMQKIYKHFDIKIIDMAFIKPYHQIIIGVKQ